MRDGAAVVATVAAAVAAAAVAALCLYLANLAVSVLVSSPPASPPLINAVATLPSVPPGPRREWLRQRTGAASGAAADPDPLERHIQATCGRLYASSAFRTATGTGDAVGAVDAVPPYAIFVGKRGSGVADHFVGAASVLLAGVLGGRRVLFEYAALDVDAGPTPLWQPRARIHDAALERHCHERVARGECPLLDWSDHTEPLGDALLQTPPRSPFNDSVGVRVVANRGVTVLVASRGGATVRTWLDEHGLAELTLFGCLFHAVFRVHPAVLAGHRALAALLNDPARVVAGVHFRTPDSEFVYQHLGEYPASVAARHRAQGEAVLLCALAAFERDARADPSLRARTLTVIVSGTSLVMRDAAVHFRKTYPRVVAVAGATVLDVRTVTDAAPLHVAGKNATVAALEQAVLEHWALARARWIIQAGMASGYSATAAFAGFHTADSVFETSKLYTLDDPLHRPCSSVVLQELASQWSGI